MKQRILPFAGLALVALLFAACGGDSDDIGDRNPDIRGEITSLTPGSGDTLITILIEGKGEPDTGYDKASVRVEEDTEVFRARGTDRVEVEWSDLAEGQTVEAWFEGPVAESYPVQAKAGRIVIIIVVSYQE
jgi:beta-N-acetylhexosaminidase